MKYIVTEDLGHGYGISVGVESKAPIPIAHIDNAKLGQYFIITSNSELVPEPETIPGARNMLCIGADIIPNGFGFAYKHLVLFDTKVGDIHYMVAHDDIFFPTQIDQELLVFCPEKPDFDKQNNGYKILRNLTIDKKRSDYVTRQH